MHRQCQQGQGAWQEVGAGAGLCRDGVKKAKVQLELDLARGAKKCEKGFCRYTEQEGPGGCTLLPPVSNIGRLLTMDKEKAEVLNHFFLPLSSLETVLHAALRWVVWKVGTEGTVPFLL